MCKKDIASPAERNNELVMAVVIQFDCYPDDKAARNMEKAAMREIERLANKYGGIVCPLNRNDGGGESCSPLNAAMGIIVVYNLYKMLDGGAAFTKKQKIANLTRLKRFCNWGGRDLFNTI